MQAGLDVFAMDSPEHKELKEVERDLNLMEQVKPRTDVHIADVEPKLLHTIIQCPFLESPSLPRSTLEKSSLAEQSQGLEKLSQICWLAHAEV